MVNHRVKDETATEQEVDVSDPAHLFDDDIYEDVDTSDPGHHWHEVGTTASEFDGALDVEDEDEGTEDIGVVDDESDEELSVNVPKHRKDSKKVRNVILPS